MSATLPSHRWQIAPADLDTAMDLARSIEIIPDNPTSLLIAQVLINRGISSAAQVEHYVHGRGQDILTGDRFSEYVSQYRFHPLLLTIKQLWT